MSQPRSEIRIGFFVMLGLLLLAGLSLQLGEGNSPFHKTYTIILKARDAGGIRNKSSVMLLGVPVGTVSGMTLDPRGTDVSIYLKIYDEFKIRDDARFAIEQASFFGDQFVAVHPEENKGTALTNLSEARLEEPGNLMEVARSASGFLQIDQSAQKLDDAISKFRQQFLSEESLTRISSGIATVRQESQDALVTMEKVNLFIKSNDVPAAVGKLMSFTQRLTEIAQSAKGALDTNGPEISAQFGEWQAASASLTNLLDGVQQGKGPAGAFLESQGAADRILNLTERLATSSSNINREGLWHVLSTTNKAKQITSHE